MISSSSAPPFSRLCDCGCNRRFTPPPSAPHKRFATEACRNAWHNARHAEAMAQFRQAEGRDRAEQSEMGDER